MINNPAIGQKVRYASQFLKSIAGGELADLRGEIVSIRLPRCLQNRNILVKVCWSDGREVSALARNLEKA